MISNVSIVSVFVTDQDASKAFYIDVLGFEEGEDITMGDGYRWCTVIAPGHPELKVSLAVPGPPLSPEAAEAFVRFQRSGGLPGVGVTVDDCRTTYEDLVAKGVEFLQEPAERPYGVEAVLRDNSGNWMVMVEPREFSPEDFEGFSFDDPA